jgi:hypothetical protein
LVAKLRDELNALSAAPKNDRLLALLLRAGELECALHDAGSLRAESAAHLTDQLAQAAVAYGFLEKIGNRQRLVENGLRTLDNLPDDCLLTVGTPEGFAYYALHPLDFADLAEMFRRDRSVLVVGIRSIGTTLGAVAAAQLHELGVEARRMSVRPSGHPYQRECAFDVGQRMLIGSALARDAAFLVCDEGPGRSGSSFLSVAESLEREGVAPDRITLFCSHHPEVGSLCAPDAAHRWSRYKSVGSGPTKRLPDEASAYIGGGEWRDEFLQPWQEWPSSWPAMERLKYLTSDRRCLLKFEGHGSYGESVRTRNYALAHSGYGASYAEGSHGFGHYPLLVGRMGRASDSTVQLLAHMAQYCAWRSQNFAYAQAEVADLQEMLETNYECEFGNSTQNTELILERPVVADARMQPHEWFQTQEGRWWKLDAATHGDDHFFPGPCDIAWDLAGVIVEWSLDRAARELFLSEYQKSSGDKISGRIANYELAYATFRLSWSKMAASSVQGTADESRLLKEYQQYRTIAEVLSTTSRHTVTSRKSP